MREDDLERERGKRLEVKLDGKLDKLRKIAFAPFLEKKVNSISKRKINNDLSQ